MKYVCKSIGCRNVFDTQQDFCSSCKNQLFQEEITSRKSSQFRQLGDISEIDVYEVNHLFNVQDPSGCLQQVIIKVLGSSTTGSTYDDISQARDLLTRWLQLNTPKKTA
jgi:hypothetical protein